VEGRGYCDIEGVVEIGGWGGEGDGSLEGGYGLRDMLCGMRELGIWVCSL
jgi:hypothetical protein